MMQNENTIKLRLIAIQWLSYDGFPAFPWLLGFPYHDEGLSCSFLRLLNMV